LHDLGYANRVVHVPAGPEVPLHKEEMASYLPQFTQGILDFSQNKNLKYDLVHSHYWMSGIAAKELKSTWKVPMVQMFHTLGLMKRRVARLPGEAEGDFRIDGEYEVLRAADRIVAATQAELAQLQWLYQVDSKRIDVIPPGVDLSHFYPIPDDEAKEFIGFPPCEKMLLFVGRIEPLKGIDTLIQAIAIMRQKGLYVCLAVIGGDGEAEPDEASAEMIRLQTMREEVGLNDLVTFLGKRSQDSLPYYYSAASAVVVPSFYESFGMVALEAMACGTPVVASQVGGLAFLVQDGVTGFTVPVDEPQALAERLTILLENPDLRQKMGRQAADFARDYSWEHIARRIVHLYEKTLTPENKPRLRKEGPV
jgi:D-inositol-3-phosphate glycosyltransferase